jgi:DivIVA domain-containing protein
MEITPELIANYQFSTSMRGFDVDEVNHFLEAIGNELARSQHQVRKATERIAALESQLAEAKSEASSAAAEADGKRAARALMAAQETADRIEQEARTESTKLLNDTTAHCARLRTDTENEIALARAKFADESAQIKAQIQSETESLKAAATAEVESARTGRISELEGEIASLTNLSGNLQADVAAMEQRISGYRALIESMTTMFRDLLDDEDALYTQPPYELRVAIPAANKRIESYDPAPAGADGAVGEAEATELTDRGTWSPDLAWSGDEKESDDPSGAYPMGLETTEMAAVDVDGAVDGVGSEEIAESDPTLAEGFVNPLLAEAGDEAGAQDAVSGSSTGGPADDVSGADWNPFEASEPGSQTSVVSPEDTDAVLAIDVIHIADADPGRPAAGDLAAGNPAAGDPGTEDTFAEDTFAEDTAAVDRFDLGYTAEFEAIDDEVATGAMAAVEVDESAEDEAPIQRQLQAFSGVDSFQSSPYVPKQVFAEDSEADDMVAPPMDLSDEAFGRPYESASYDTQAFAAVGPSADEFDFQPVDGAFAPADDEDSHGELEFDDSAFAPSYVSSDRYLRELDDAVNRESEDLGDLEAFMSTHPNGDETPRRRFRRK